jgi:endonuclease YncB( thermonuclease family)
MELLPVQTPAMASKALLVVAALTALAWPTGVAGQGITATVLSIGDGDTIRVRQAGKALTVMLACIDAPETASRPPIAIAARWPR